MPNKTWPHGNVRYAVRYESRIQRRDFWVISKRWYLFWLSVAAREITLKFSGWKQPFFLKLIVLWIRNFLLSRLDNSCVPRGITEVTHSMVFSCQMSFNLPQHLKLRAKMRTPKVWMGVKSKHWNFQCWEINELTKYQQQWLRTMSYVADKSVGWELKIDIGFNDENIIGDLDKSSLFRWLSQKFD